MAINLNCLYKAILSIWMVFGMAAIGVVLNGSFAHASGNVIAISADDALKLLVNGNERYILEKPLHQGQDKVRREETARNGQNPFAAILSCADSRVPPEIFFDMGIGDLFVVRVAGNVADVDEIGTLEYGAGHLKIPLIVVVGHSKCGAVTAVVKKDHVGGNIPKLVDNIIPAAEAVRQKSPGLAPDFLIDEVITVNVFQAIQDILTHSMEIFEMVETGKVKIVGAVYDIETGVIHWLGPHPAQLKIMVDVKVAEALSKKTLRKAEPVTMPKMNIKAPAESAGGHDEER